MSRVYATRVSEASASLRTQRFAQILLFVLLTFAILGLAPLSGREKVGSTGQGDLFRQLAYVAIFAIAVAKSGGFRYPARLLVMPASIMALLGWCLLSLTWAIEPSIAARRLILTSMVIWLIFALVRQAGYERAMAATRAALLMTLALSYLAIAVSPGAIHQVAEVNDPGLIGNWRGVLPQKNFAGALCAFTIILVLFDPKSYSALWRAFIVGAAAFFLYKTHSKTSIGLLAFMVPIYFIVFNYNPKYRLLMALTLLLPVGLVCMWPDPWDMLAAPFGGADSLTGRVQIWPVLIGYWQDNWLFGSGYGSFWNIGSASPVYQYGKGWVTNLGNGHNGYLDLLAQIGLPGLALAVAAMVVIPIGRLLSETQAERTSVSVVFILLLFCAAHNFTESSILDRDMIVEVFMVLAIALSRELPRAQAVRAAAPLAPRRRLRATALKAAASDRPPC